MLGLGFPQFGLLTSEVYSQVKVVEAARNIRKVCGQQRTIPFDLERCADFFRIRIREEALPPTLSGRLSINGDTYIIELRASDSHHRRRFTLAHELAHLCFRLHCPVLPEERGLKQFVSTIGNREERLCNRIAAELLMPHRQFGVRARALRPCFCSLEQLARDFDVSLAAALQRLEDLRVWSVARATLAEDSGSRRVSLSSVHLRTSIRSVGDKRVLRSRLSSVLKKATLSFTEEVDRATAVGNTSSCYAVMLVAGLDVVLQFRRSGELSAFVLA